MTILGIILEQTGMLMLPDVETTPDNFYTNVISVAFHELKHRTTKTDKACGRISMRLESNVSYAALSIIRVEVISFTNHITIYNLELIAESHFRAERYQNEP
jgi:hypothetical protein